MMVRIPVDFETMTQVGDEWHVPIPETGQDVLASFQPGQRIVLAEEDDFELEAILQYDERAGVWYGVPDWSTRHALWRWLLLEEPHDEALMGALHQVLRVLPAQSGLEVRAQGPGGEVFPPGQRFVLMLVRPREHD